MSQKMFYLHLWQDINYADDNYPKIREEMQYGGFTIRTTAEKQLTDTISEVDISLRRNIDVRI